MPFHTTAPTPPRSAGMIGPALLALTLVGCAPQAETPTPTAAESASPSAAYVQPDNCPDLLGPLEAEFLAEGAELMAGPHDVEGAKPGGVEQRMLDLGGIYCSYAEEFVDGSGRGLAAAPLDAESRVEAESLLAEQGLERISAGDVVLFRAAGSPEEFPSFAQLHVLRDDSWIYTANNWGGQAEQPFADVEGWAEQLAELAYTD